MASECNKVTLNNLHQAGLNKPVPTSTELCTFCTQFINYFLTKYILNFFVSLYFQKLFLRLADKTIAVIQIFNFSCMCME